MSSNLLSASSSDIFFKVLGCGKISSLGEINRKLGLPYCFIAYTLCGDAKAIINSKAINLCTNSILILPKSIPFLLKANLESTIIWAEFNCSDTFIVEKDVLYNAPPSIAACFNEILLEFGKEQIDSLRLTDCYITELAVKIKRLQASKKHTVSELCKDYIDSHFNEQISNELLSSLFNLSVSQLIFKFNKQYGLPPIKYLNKVRIDKAKELLLAGIKPSDVAIKVGYKNIFYFSRVFKKLTGVSPTEFKN